MPVIMGQRICFIGCVLIETYFLYIGHIKKRLWNYNSCRFFIFRDFKRLIFPWNHWQVLQILVSYTYIFNKRVSFLRIIWSITKVIVDIALLGVGSMQKNKEFDRDTDADRKGTGVNRIIRRRNSKQSKMLHFRLHGLFCHAN